MVYSMANTVDRTDAVTVDFGLGISPTGETASTPKLRELQGLVRRSYVY